MKWDSFQTRILWRLKDADISDASAAELISELFECEVLHWDVRAVWERSKESGAVRRWRRERRNYEYQSPWEERVEAIVSNKLHLVDLKRAGHSPSQTEYTIEHESIRHYPTTQSRSFVGSSAADCAEWA